MNVLITGGAVSIGSHLSQFFLESVALSVSSTWRYCTAARCAVGHGHAKAVSGNREMNLRYGAPSEGASYFGFCPTPLQLGGMRYPMKPSEIQPHTRRRGIGRPEAWCTLCGNKRSVEEVERLALTRQPAEYLLHIERLRPVSTGIIRGRHEDLPSLGAGGSSG